MKSGILILAAAALLAACGGNCLLYTSFVARQQRAAVFAQTLDGFFGYCAYLLARAGGHPRHHGRAGPARPDADRLFERYEEKMCIRDSDKLAVLE